MPKRVIDFVNEFTNNFSELYVETFLVRYLTEYDKNTLLETIKLTNQNIQKKINKLFLDNLSDMGFTKEDIKKYLF